MAMSTKGDVATVKGYWDDQAGVEPGWYCETYDAGGNPLDDSQKVWFPVDLDKYRRDQRKELIAALKAAFPGADIRLDWTSH